MHLLSLTILLFLAGCTSPIYQHTTFDIEEFIADSRQIAQGKFAILALEEQSSADVVENHQFYEDTINDGDELAIALYCPQRPDRVAALEEINKQTGFRVCNGNVCLPHLSTLEVEGLTLNEGREKIQTAYCEQLPNTQVFVNFKKRRERQVQIIGANQSMVSVDGRTRLSEVLAIAKIPPYANLFKSYVMRNGQQLSVDLYKLIHQGDINQNIVMRGGDQIFIAHTTDAIVMVTGEIFRPTVIPIPYGFIPLNEALVMAGGIPFTGNKNYIQVIRGDMTRPKIYCLAWKDIIHVPNPSLLLMPGDVVVISEKPLTEWNRFINQLQPSTASMQAGYNTYEVLKSIQ